MWGSEGQRTLPPLVRPEENDAAPDTVRPRIPEEKPEDEDAPKRLSVKVIDQHSNEVLFKIKMSTELGKVMITYCQRQGLDPKTVRFLHDGERLNEKDTPETRAMGDEETIQMVLEQLGGDEGDEDGPEAAKSPPPLAKPAEDTAALQKLCIKVQDQQNNELHFMIKPQTKLSKVMKAFCDRQGLGPGTVKFLHEGIRVQDNDTPESLEMEDGDIIQAFLEQTGGEGPQHCTSLDIKIQHDSTDLFYKIKKITNMKQLIDSHCKSQKKAPNTLRFFYDNRRLSDLETPDSLDIRNNDIINVYPEQQEGAESDAGEVAGEKLKDETVKLSIIIRDHDGQDITFQIKMVTPMSKVITAYYNRMGRTPGSLRFYTGDGARIQDNDTPISFDLEDGDIVDVHVEQQGGSGEPEIKSEDLSKPIALKVKDQTGGEITYHVKMNTKLSRLIESYYKQVGKEEGSLRFFTPDGKRVTPEDTPASCHLEDGDSLEVHMWLEGGCH